MKGVYDAHPDKILKHAYISKEVGMLYGNMSIVLLVLQQHNPPFTFNDYRLGLISRGHVHVRINLVEKYLEPGMFFCSKKTTIFPSCRFRLFSVYRHA